MSTKRLLRKIELLNELKVLEMELKDLLGNVMAGALAHALGDTQAKERLKKFEAELAKIQARAEELQAETETLDLLMTMGIDTQD
jgi:multidrug resistance efflux pump